MPDDWKENDTVYVWLVGQEESSYSDHRVSLPYSDFYQELQRPYRSGLVLQQLAEDTGSGNMSGTKNARETHYLNVAAKPVFLQWLKSPEKYVKERLSIYFRILMYINLGWVVFVMAHRCIYSFKKKDSPIIYRRSLIARLVWFIMESIVMLSVCGLIAGIVINLIAGTVNLWSSSNILIVIFAAFVLLFAIRDIRDWILDIFLPLKTYTGRIAGLEWDLETGIDGIIPKIYEVQFSDQSFWIPQECWEKLAVGQQIIIVSPKPKMNWEMRSVHQSA